MGTEWTCVLEMGHRMEIFGSSLYLISTLHFMCRQYPICTVHVQSVPHIHIPCPDCTKPITSCSVGNISLQLMSRHYPTVSSLLPLSCQYISSPAHVTIYRSHVHSENHISHHCLVRIPPLLPMSHHYITFPLQV